MIVRSQVTLLIFLIGPFLASPAFADDFSHAKQLLKQNKPKQAYQFLINEEGYHMGEPEYDSLLASVAFDAGLYHEAIFAFERVLIQQPNNLVARIKVAISYYKIDELENARHELNLVLKAKLEGELRKTFDHYLELINDKIASRNNEFSATHTFRQGWDSNINSATNESEIKLTIGNYRPTDGVDKETSDTYSELLNQFNYRHHFNVNSSLYSQLAYNIRDNNKHDFDTQTADIKLGYQQKTTLGQLSFPLGYQSLWMDGSQLRYVSSLGASLSRSDKDSFANYSIQYGKIRYPDQQALNVDHMVFSYAIGTNTKKLFNQQYALFYGDETEQNSLYQFNARKYMGVQVRLPLRLTPRQYLIPRLVYQRAEHKKQHPFFFTVREDEHLAASVDWNWQLASAWQLIGQISHASNKSTVELYSYQRNTLFGGITYKY